MANLEQLEILKSGVENWNRWREENPDEKVDLSKANLRETDLIKANLHRADLKGADLSRTNLSWVYLVYADLTDTYLNNANFNFAIIGRTHFCNVDLSNVRNLDNCIYRRNSYIDYQTLKKSKNLPLSFLRGCGLSDKYINGLPSLFEQGEQFYNCFISHSSKDHEFTNKLYTDLQERGIRVWFAPEDMKIAEKIRPALHKAIERHERLLIILSKDSIKSPWVEDEVEKAFEQERKKKENVLIPIRLDNSIFDIEAGWADSIRNTRNIGDFTKWETHDEYMKNFDKLVESLRVEAEG